MLACIAQLVVYTDPHPPSDNCWPAIYALAFESASDTFEYELNKDYESTIAEVQKLKDNDINDRVERIKDYAGMGASLIFKAIELCMQLGIGAEELNIDGKSVRDLIVSKYFENDQERCKRLRPKNIGTAKKQLDAYFGIEEPK